MGKIVLDSIGLNFKDSLNSYLDLGCVGNVVDFAITLHKSYTGSGNQMAAVGDNGDRNYHGMMMAFRKRNGRVIWHTFYENTDDPHWSLVVKAHEQAHVAHALGKIDYLRDFVGIRKLRVFECYQDYKICNDSERDLIANLVAIRALELKGCRVLEIPINNTHPAIAPAMCVYQRGIFYDAVSVR